MVYKFNLFQQFKPKSTFERTVVAILKTHRFGYEGFAGPSAIGVKPCPRRAAAGSSPFANSDGMETKTLNNKNMNNIEERKNKNGNGKYVKTMRKILTVGTGRTCYRIELSRTVPGRVWATSGGKVPGTHHRPRAAGVQPRPPGGPPFPRGFLLALPLPRVGG